MADATRTRGEGQFSFHVEWLETHSGLIRQFHLKFFEVDETLEIYDGKNKRMFLKRVRPSEAPELGDFYVGATVTIFSRKLRVVEYADKVTADFFASKRQRSLALLCGSATDHIGKLLRALHEGGIKVGRIRSMRLSARQAEEFANASDAAHRKADVGPRKGGPGGSALAGMVGRKDVIAIELVGDLVVARWLAMLGPADGSRAGTLAARFGADGMYGSPSRLAAESDIAYFIDKQHESTASFSGCSLVLLKPHTVLDGSYAEILDAIIAEGYNISAIRSVGLDSSAAEDLLEVYKGVVPEYSRWIKHFASGKSVALEVTGPDVVDKIRALFGPYEPELARILRPDTLRAKLGKNSVKNCAHVTDIDADGPLESKFVFHVLADFE